MLISKLISYVLFISLLLLKGKANLNLVLQNLLDHRDALLELIINDPVVNEPGLLRRLDLLQRVLQPQLDRLLGVSPAPMQPPRELLRGGGVDEERRALELLRLVHAELAGALDVDVEDADLPVGNDVHHALPAGPVVVPVDLRVLDELAGGNALLHLLDGDEVVVLPVNFPDAGLAGGMTDGEGEDTGVLVEESVDDGALTDSGGADEDDRLDGA